MEKQRLLWKDSGSFAEGTVSVRLTIQDQGSEVNTAGSGTRLSLSADDTSGNHGESLVVEVGSHGGGVTVEMT